MIKKFIVYNQFDAQWVECTGIKELLVIHQQKEVLSALTYIEDQVENKGLYAAGFIAYEAAPAFDDSMRVQKATGCPLLYFGLFEHLKPISLETASITNPDQMFEKWETMVPQDVYLYNIERIKQEIALGNTYQVNYTYRLTSPCKKDPFHVFKRLYMAQPTPYGAFIDDDDFAICSLSPELFFRIEGDTLVSNPMKGTIQRGYSLSEDEKRRRELSVSLKDQAENVMIVDMIRNDMGRISHPGSVHVRDLYHLEKYPTVWQMTSTVTSITNRSLTDIVKALFPCASITGAPKIETMRIIKELETSPRNIYTGSIGYVLPGRKAVFNVAIRTLYIDKRKGIAEYGTGGGIVWDSDANAEYRESILKTQILEKDHPTFDLLETIRWEEINGWFLLARHVERLKKTADYFNYPFDERLLHTALDELSAGFNSAQKRVRLLLNKEGQFHFEVFELNENPRKEPLQLILAKTPINTDTPFVYHKTTHRCLYDAYKELYPDHDDVILWNGRNELTETCVGNLLIRIEGQWYTPPISSGLLAGTYRDQLIEEKLVKERVLHKNDLKHCEAIQRVNSVRKREDVVARGV